MRCWSSVSCCRDIPPPPSYGEKNCFSAVEEKETPGGGGTHGSCPGSRKFSNRAYIHATLQPPEAAVINWGVSYSTCILYTSFFDVMTPIFVLYGKSYFAVEMSDGAVLPESLLFQLEQGALPCCCYLRKCTCSQGKKWWVVVLSDLHDFPEKNRQGGVGVNAPTNQK